MPLLKIRSRVVLRRLVDQPLSTVLLLAFQFVASLIAQLVKNPPAMRRPQFDSWVWKIRWRRDRLPTPVFLGFPCGSAGKESTCNAGDLGLIPGLGWSSGGGKDYPLQNSGLENSMDCTVHGVTKSWTQLSDFHFHFQFVSYDLITLCIKVTLCIWQLLTKVFLSLFNMKIIVVKSVLQRYSRIKWINVANCII